MSDTEQQQATFLSRLEQLQTTLQQNLPGYEGMLQVIHKQLAADENMLHILTDEQVGVIVQGLARRKNIVIAESAKKTAGSGSGKKVPKDLDSYM